MKCQQCDTGRHKRLHDDPRDPPLDDEPCLCKGCVLDAIDEEIEAARALIIELEQQRRKISA